MERRQRGLEHRIPADVGAPVARDLVQIDGIGRLRWLEVSIRCPCDAEPVTDELNIGVEHEDSERLTGVSPEDVLDLLRGRCQCTVQLRCEDVAEHRADSRTKGRRDGSLVELEDGARWLTIARTVTPQGRRYGAVPAEFAVGLGVSAALGAALAVARGIDLAGEATPIGLGCRACLRDGCPQRSMPPAGRALLIDERERGVSAFTFGGD